VVETRTIRSEEVQMYVAGVASAVEARTPTTVASILCVEEGMDSVSDTN